MSTPAIRDVYPLSPAQRGMLFHSLYQPASGVYVVQLAFTLHGTLDATAFEQAWQALAARHDVLRTAFAWDKLDAPLQVVGNAVRLSCEMRDLRTLDAAGQASALNDHLTSDRRCGFVLSAAPLMRVQAFRLADQRHRVICTYHHLLLDGWSLPLLLREWRQLYLAACMQRSADLPPAPRYRDHIVWLQRQDREAALAFWREQLRGFTTPTRLGHDAAPATEPDMQSAALDLPADLSQRIAHLAQANRLTTGTLVQGAWALLLSRHADSDDVVFGLTRAGRPAALPDAQRTAGMFITTLPMRTRIEPAQPLIEWLQALQARQLAQQPHEHVALVDLRAVSEVGAHQALFDSVVVFENYPAEALPSGRDALQLDDVEVIEQTNYPLSLFAIAGEQLQLKLLYDRNRHDDAAATRMLGHLHALLDGFCAQSQQTLGSIELMNAAERAALDTGNRTACPPPDWTVTSRLTQQAARTPTAIAITDTRGDTDYATLDARSARLAARLTAQGIGRGQRVGLCLARGADMVVGLLAILRCGAAYVPLDAAYPQARLQHMLDDSAAAALLLHDATRDALSFWHGARIDIDEDLDAHDGADSPAAPPAPGDAAYVIYTSGSSGLPKGVEIRHLSLSNLLQAMAARTGFSAANHWLAVTTLSFDIAALELFLPLVSGARLVIADEADVRDAQRLAARIDSARIDTLQATPATWRLLLAGGWTPSPGMTLLCGGEALDSALARRLTDTGATLWNVYGPTETTIWSGALRVTPELLDGTTVPVGAPLDNTGFHVLDSRQRALPVGAAGELCISGLGLSSGYVGRPALTAEKFIDHPLPAPADDSITYSAKLYRTGDRVRQRADGHFDYLGRFDHQTKLRGYRIELEEIDSVLRRHEDVAQAAVVVQGEDATDARLVAFVCLEANAAQEDVAARLRSHLAQQLPAFMLPAAFHVLPALPLTPNGKTDRRALAALQAAAQPARAAPPATPLESTLLDIWRSTLKNDAVGVHDNFFEAGGHSLLVINVQGKLRQALGVDVALVDLFRHPTIAALARHVEALRAAPDAGTADTPDRRATELAAGRQRLTQRRTQQARQATVDR